MNIVIRNAEIEDTKKIDEFLTKLILDERKYDPNINENCEITNYYENIISKEDTCILVAEYDRKLVGYLYGFIKNDGDTCISLVSKLDALYVEEDFRNMNIGNNLIEEFKKWCLTRNVKNIEVNLWQNNEIAFKLYSKHGFKPSKITMNVEI